jgi:Ser/Thr protein kinase RdoA (MazF antagonist)
VSAQDPLPAIEAALAERYGIRGISAQLIKSKYGRHVVRIERGDGPPLLVRAYAAASHPRDRIDAQARTLAWLERQHYRAPRVITAADGELTVAYGAWWILAATWIDGRIARFDPSDFAAIADALGRLHALVPDSVVPPTSFAPRAEAETATARLEPLAKRLDGERAEAASGFLATLRGAASLTELPSSLVHTDPFPENAVIAPGADAILIDWDDAGLGTAAIDLGYLLATTVADHPTQSVDPQRIGAIITAYHRHRSLTPDELRSLPAATAFTSAVYGALILASAVETGGGDANWRSWWRRHEASEEIAAAARDLLGDRGARASP